jgi:hypothetical protein
MDDDDIVIEYRGYLLIQRYSSCTGTQWIARPDGTWRYSEPTYVENDSSEWVVGRRLTNGTIEEFAVSCRYEDARLWVDARLLRDARPPRSEPGGGTAKG